MREISEVSAYAAMKYKPLACMKNEILALARMKSADTDEIFGFASDEIKSTHRLSDFIRLQGGFHHPR